MIMTVEIELLGERNLSQCHLVYQNLTQDGLGLKPCLHSGIRVTECLPQPWHLPASMSQGHIPCRPHFVTARFPHLKATNNFVNKSSDGDQMPVPCTNKF
jgi:hypothetical protein